jgi:hypothetical protein
MKREPKNSRIIKIAGLACGAMLDDRYADEIPERATAAASAR